MRAFAAPLLVALSLLCAPAHSSSGWTFCVADAGGKDIWITGVFPAIRDRERLEADLKSYLKSRGVSGAARDTAHDYSPCGRVIMGHPVEGWH